MTPICCTNPRPHASGFTGTDIYGRIVLDEREYTCLNCNKTLTEKEYKILTRPVFGQPAQAAAPKQPSFFDTNQADTPLFSNTPQ